MVSGNVEGDLDTCRRSAHRLLVSVAVQPLKFTFLQSAQQFGPDLDGNISHLVEKQRALVGKFKSPNLSIRTQPANNHERGPSRLARMAEDHAYENFASNLGTSLRGIKRCAKTLNLLRAPGTVRPPPLASTCSASSATSSGL